MKNGTRAFTLIELLVVIAIIGILALVLFANFNEGSAEARDAQRKADLRTLQNAIELYKQKYKRYPAGCQGATTDATTRWSGGTYGCPTGDQYIVGLAPEFIPVLPRDPRLNDAVTHSGYVYTVNSEGSAYKIMALNTVETETISQTHDFFRCDTSWPLGLFALGNQFSSQDPGLCVRTPTAATGPCTNAVSPANECITASLFNKTYALSGGYSADARGNTTCPDRGREYDTEIVRCR